MSKVSIVIVAHNAGEYLEDCLGSIFRQSYTDLEVIWVDSASTDGSVQRIRDRYPQVQVLALAANAGYRRGINTGAREARGEYLVVCNQDTMLHPQWLAQMVASVESDPAVGIVAPKILLFDRPDLINEAGNTLHYSGLYGSRGLGAPASQFDKPEPIAAMSGCCFLVRRDLWQRLGGFSEDFDRFDTGWHASYEDVDLAWRAQLAGHMVVYCPRALMYHKYTPKGWVGARFCSYEWGRYLTLLRNYERRTLILLAPVLAALEAGAWLYAGLQGPRALRAKARTMGWLLANSGEVREMRRRVQAMRTVGDRAIVARMSCRIRMTHVLAASPLAQLAQRAVDAGFEVYYRFLTLGLRLLDRQSQARDGRERLGEVSS